MNINIAASAISAAFHILRLGGFHQARIPVDPLDLTDYERYRQIQVGLEGVSRALQREAEDQEQENRIENGD